MKISNGGRPASRTSPAAVAALIFTASVTACSSDAEPALTVAGVPIPQAHFESLAPPEQQTLLDLVAFGATVAGESIDSLIAPAVQRANYESVVRTLPFALAARRMDMDEGTLRAAYARDPEWELEVRHVVRLVEPGDPPAVRDSARAVAASVARRAADGEDFARLAAEFSEEPGAAERGGLLEPGRKGSWVDPFWNAAVALQPGETSGVVESMYGYHVLRLDDRRPVPYAEANRAALLARVVPQEIASEAMAEWAATTGAIVIDPPALSAARTEILAGNPADGETLIATGAGAEYTGADLTRGWALLAPEARTALEQGDELAFARWAESDARQVLWGRGGIAMGLEPAPDAASSAAATWTGAVSGWAQVLGFSSGMSRARIYEAARQATLSGAPEVRARRMELRSFRPLLRELYPVVAPEG